MTIAAKLLLASQATAASSVEFTNLLSPEASTRARLHTTLSVDESVAARLAGEKRDVTVRGFPLADGASEDFALKRVEVFSKQATARAISYGEITPLPLPDVALFQGNSISDSGKHLVLAVVDGAQIRAIVRRDGIVDTVIGPLDGKGRSHEIRGEHSLDLPDEEICSGTVDSPDAQHAATLSNAPAPRAATTANQTLHLELGIDVAYNLYAGPFHSSTTAAINYVAQLIGAVSSIYERDAHVEVTIKDLIIWTTPDPYDATGSTNDQLSNYRGHAGGRGADAYHYLSHRGGGGIAYVDAVCDEAYGYAVSNIDGTDSFPISGYVWDAMVVAHEAGHNLGTEHTHCYSPPIDKCYRAEAGCYNGPQVPQVGEIMSYCHIGGYGIDLHFSDRVVDHIRQYSETRSCLVEEEPVCGDGVVSRGEQCDDGNSDDGDCCSSSCQIDTGGTASCDDGKFCTVDYSCPDDSCAAAPRDCDDGNPCTDDECDDGLEQCIHTPNHQACDDGLFCTELDFCSNGTCAGMPKRCSDDDGCTADRCDEEGLTCLHTDLPRATSCHSALSSALQIQDKDGTGRDAMSWKWLSADPLDRSEFGDPKGDEYALCIYNEQEQLIGGMSTQTPAALQWRSTQVSASYRGGPTGGMRTVALQAGTVGRAKIAAKGKGAWLRMPELPVSGPLTVQLRHSSGAECWESTYAAPFKKNGETKLKAIEK